MLYHVYNTIIPDIVSYFLAQTYPLGSNNISTEVLASPSLDLESVLRHFNITRNYTDASISKISNHTNPRDLIKSVSDSPEQENEICLDIITFFNITKTTFVKNIPDLNTDKLFELLKLSNITNDVIMLEEEKLKNSSYKFTSVSPAVYPTLPSVTTLAINLVQNVTSALTNTFISTVQNTTFGSPSDQEVMMHLSHMTVDDTLLLVEKLVSMETVLSYSGNGSYCDALSVVKTYSVDHVYKVRNPGKFISGKLFLAFLLM